MVTTKISLFEDKKIRKTIHNNEWWFSVVDVIQALTDQSDNHIARKYWNKVSQRLRDEGSQLVTICHQLKLEASDGKKYETDCANTEGMLRIIQSVPSSKAEPLKRWLAKVGYERIQEINDPELAQERMKQLYEKKGYSKNWIDKRLRGIAIRQNLTDEWKHRGIFSENDYAILTAEISKAAFGLTPAEYKKLKGLRSENLRDHMTDLELIFTMLGERVTTEISEIEKPETFSDNKKVARRGGGVAGVAREKTENEIGKSVTSKENYINKPESRKMLGR